MGRKIAVGLLALVFLGAVALFAVERFAAEILFKPDHGFAEEEKPAAPDYADLANWSAWPGREDAADRLPEGVTAMADSERPADVFYVHPTVYLKKDAWNADVADPVTNMLVDELPVLGQATAFNGCCRVYAPRYRQATLWTFMADEADNRAAIGFAYQDVARAFDHFVASIDADRPIILASHSQGTHHLVRLLDEKIIGTPIADRIVVVYAIGGGMYEEQPARGLDGFPYCETAADLHCIVTWDAIDAAQSTGRDLDESSLSRWIAGAYQPANDTRLGCVNPLSMTKDGEGAIEDNKGMVELDASQFAGVFVGREAPALGTQASLGAPLPQSVSAICGDRGLLVDIAKVEDQVGATMPGGSLHLQDYSLFYMDVFADAQARVASFIAGAAE